MGLPSAHVSRAPTHYPRRTNAASLASEQAGGEESTYKMAGFLYEWDI